MTSLVVLKMGHFLDRKIVHFSHFTLFYTIIEKSSIMVFSTHILLMNPIELVSVTFTQYVNYAYLCSNL